VLALISSDVDAAPASEDETETVASTHKHSEDSKPTQESTQTATAPDSISDTDRRITTENETIWLEEKLSPTTQWLERAVNPLRRWMEDKVQRPAKQESRSSAKEIDHSSLDIETSQDPKSTDNTAASQTNPLINTAQAGLIATSQVPGDVLKVKLLRNAPMRYRVKLISLQGQIHYVYINASNAQIITQPQASPSSPKTQSP